MTDRGQPTPQSVAETIVLEPSNLLHGDSKFDIVYTIVLPNGMTVTGPDDSGWGQWYNERRGQPRIPSGIVYDIELPGGMHINSPEEWELYGMHH